MVKYLKGASGTTDVSAAVMGGTYQMLKVAPGSAASLRLVVTVRSGVVSGTVGNWLVSATSRRDVAWADAVGAKVPTS